MNPFAKLFAALCLSAVGFTAGAGEPRKIEVQPQTVKFSAPQLTLTDALKELQYQSGNPLKDLRQNPKNPTVALKPGAFWPTLDAIGKETGIGFNTYQPDGGVALVDTPYRAMKTHYSGIFRFAVKSISVTRDDEIPSQQCEVILDTAWEPRFRALFLNLEEAAVEYRTKKRVVFWREKLIAQTAFAVAGKCATQGIKLSFAAPERTTEQFSVSGSVRVIGVPKLLDFEFGKLKELKAASARTDEKDGVKVSVTLVEVRKTRWTAELETVYPKGALVKLQSFEEPVLLEQNRIWLTWTDPNTNKTRELDWKDQDPQDSTSGTKIRFHFTPRGDTPLPPPGAEVTLRYRTPSRVIAFTVPFAFADLPLP